MKRRTFIVTTTVAVTAVAAGFLFNWYKESKWKRIPFALPVVLSSFCDELTIRNIGNSYRSIVPAENSRGKLMTLLSNDKLNKELESSDYSGIAGELEMKVEQDFKQEKIVVVEGWVISVTEARQCALLSLS